jgi:RNAse (barnase) inhibitor barstar
MATVTPNKGDMKPRFSVAEMYAKDVDSRWETFKNEVFYYTHMLYQFHSLVSHY